MRPGAPKAPEIVHVLFRMLKESQRIVRLVDCDRHGWRCKRGMFLKFTQIAAICSHES
jgi:hypothetical protein